MARYRQLLWLRCSVFALAVLALAPRGWAQLDVAAYVTPQQRAQAVRDQIAKQGPGVWNLPAGEYDFGDTGITFPAGSDVRGAGPGKTVLRCSAVFNAQRATAFGLGDGTTFVRNLTLASTCQPNQQSAVIGFTSDAAQPRTATLENVEVLGQAWGVYTWFGPDGNSLTIRDSSITAARVAVMLGRSSGANAQVGLLERVRIKLDPTLSTQGGAVTDPNYGGVFGVICRGGRCTLRDVQVTGTGSANGPRLVAVTDWFDGGSAGVTIDVGGLATKLAAGGAKEVFDVDVRLGRLVLGGSGGGTGGTLAVRPR